jgi:AmmeMemoRadiSam system protein A
MKVNFMPLVYSVFVPHPPIIVPEIGRGEETECSATLAAYREVARNLVEARVDTVLLISPHATLLREGVTIVSDQLISGDFAQFGNPKVKLSFLCHQELVEVFASQLPKGKLYSEKLDHGALVPMYFLNEAGWQGKLLLLSMPIEQPEVYGQKIGEILKDFPERIALVASGDLSHRLKEDGPYGLHPSGPEFDQRIVRALSRDPSDIQRFPVEFAEEAGECGWRSLRLALAVQEGMPKVLSYEGPFGVGYLVAELYHSSPIAHWARLCLRTFLEKGSTQGLIPPTIPELQLRRACFVTLKKNGELRGCIGTTEPWRESLAQEIEYNAIAAGTEDPRFWPVEEDELTSLTLSVDVLGEMEKIQSMEDLDPWRYGVLVRGRGRSGLLLPHLEGIDTAKEQVSIAKQKAGLSVDEPVELWRFEVVRYLE